MVSINPQRINLSRANATQNGNQNSQKPTLNQMHDLYNNWCSVSIPYYPPSAASDAVKNRTEAMKKYIKENNLNIDVNNLELFFAHVKKETSSMGGMMSKEQAVLIMLNDYIENGYDPQSESNKDKLLREAENLRNEYIKSNTGKKLEFGTPNLDDITGKIKNTIDKSSDVFK